MAFKQDEDFLRFVTMGAAGSARVSSDLRSGFGHRTVELERYAMANKIWATKIKRLRLADLLCLDCGIRVEARAKSDLKVRMSHSERDGREWDHGMRDRDLCGFLPWANGEPAGAPSYFEIGAMRAATEYARLGAPKAASEGAERDLTWPCRVATKDAIVEEIVDGCRVRVKPLGQGPRRTVSLPPDVPAFVYVREGQELRVGVDFIVGCVRPPGNLHCPGETWDYASDLESDNPIDRYCAVKAAGLRLDAATSARLLRIVADSSEDARIRLEASASLARIDPARYTQSVIQLAREDTGGDNSAEAMRMEAIFVLSELRTEEARDALSLLASHPTLGSEARCACIWGLGVTGFDDPARLLPFIADEDEDVALHALAGVSRLPEPLVREAVRLLGGTPREAASASTLLASQEDAGIEGLLEAAAGSGQSADWAIAALGDLRESDVRRVARGRLPDEVETALVPRWVQSQSWLRRQQMETPLQFMQRQTIRHLA